MAARGQVAELDDVSAAPDRPGRGHQRRGRALAWGAAALVVALGLGATFTWRWFVRPTADGPVPADAVVVFGGAGGRFERALALMEAGYADVIVLSDPYNEERRASRYQWFCRNDGSRPGHPVHDYEAICFDPEPQTTRGEARYLAGLAEERGWERVDLVTSVDQATRARMLVGRCWDGEVASVVVPSDESRVVRLAYEWGAMARATLQRRSC